jgi:hypothetical protein
MVALLQLFCGFLFFNNLLHCPEKNQKEFDIACEKEHEKISNSMRFWKQKDDELDEANRESEKDYNDRISAFYEGKLKHYPGPRGPVGVNFAIHIGRTIAHHTATYYDSNLKRKVEFDVFPDGICKIK